MKPALIAMALIVFSYSSGLAYQLSLEWDPNVEQDLAGYIVYYGAASRDYDYDVDIGDETSCTISGLSSGVTYYFAVTAYDIEGNESDYSEEISYAHSREGDESGAPGSSGGGGGGGCFISAAADGKKSGDGLMAIVELILMTFTGFLLNRHKRRQKPAKNLPNS